MSTFKKTGWGKYLYTADNHQNRPYLKTKAKAQAISQPEQMRRSLEANRRSNKPRGFGFGG